MKSNIIHQAFYDLRHQPVIGTVTMIGTALSIFLIMIIVKPLHPLFKSE